MFKHLAKFMLLILDDFGLALLTDATEYFGQVDHRFQ